MENLEKMASLIGDMFYKVWNGNPFYDTFYVDRHFLNSTGVK